MLICPKKNQLYCFTNEDGAPLSIESEANLPYSEEDKKFDEAIIKKYHLAEANTHEK